MATSIFDAQGQLAMWSGVGSGRISNSSKLLCMTSLPASFQRILSRTAEKKVATQFIPLSVYREFFRRSRAVNNAVGGWIWPNSGLLRALMYAIVICKYIKDQMKTSQGKVVTSIFKTLKGSLLCGPWSDLAKFRTIPRCYVCHP